MSATGLGGGTSVSKLLAAGCWLLAAHWPQTLGPHDSPPGLEVLRSGLLLGVTGILVSLCWSVCRRHTKPGFTSTS